MFQRTLTAFRKRLTFPHDNIFIAPHFYEFVYHLTEAFEGRDALARESRERYTLLGKNWLSSFSEMFKTFKGKTLQEIKTTSNGIYLRFSDDLAFRIINGAIMFGPDDGIVEGSPIEFNCYKNFVVPESCSLEFVRNLVIGHQITSAGDWGDRFEFGLSDDLMFAVETKRIQIYRTRNPPEHNLL